MRLLAGCGADPASIEDCLRLGAKGNAPRSVNGSIRCVSPGINSNASFSSLLGRPLLHPLESTFILRGSIFRSGRTFRNYTGHLREACLLTGQPLDWYNPSVREIARSLEHARISSFRFPNFLYTQDLYGIINKLGRIGEFPQISFLTFLFSLRIPSEALCMRRARDSERLAEFVPHRDKVLIGVRPCSGAGCLILKLAWRTNLSGACILKRMCLGADASHQARKICPPHRIWPIIQERASPGELVSPSFARHNSNRILKFTLTRMCFSDGPKYTCKDFHLGASQELLQTGNSLDVINVSGCWWGSGFRRYVDLEMDSAFRISRFLIVVSDSDS